MYTTETGDKRLLELADLLDNIPKTAFEMKSWMVSGDGPSTYQWEERIPSNVMGVALKERLVSGVAHGAYVTPHALPTTLNSMHKCGFAACAVGWAGMHPPFIKQGFMMAAEEQAFSDFIFEPAYADLIGVPAVCKFFELDKKKPDWIYLFNPIGYKQESPSPTVVAQRLRSFANRRIAGKEGISHQWRSVYKEQYYYPVRGTSPLPPVIIVTN